MIYTQMEGTAFLAEVAHKSFVHIFSCIGSHPVIPHSKLLPPARRIGEEHRNWRMDDSTFPTGGDLQMCHDWEYGPIPQKTSKKITGRNYNGRHKEVL